jgi:hypothetical protein
MATRQPPANPLDLTRRSFEAAGSGDYDLMISFYGDGSVFDMAAWGLGVHTGLAAIRTFFEQWIGAYEEFDMDLEELRDLGGGAVFAIALQTARPARARYPTQLRHAAIAVWQADIAIRVTNYRDIAQARALAKRVAGSTE